MSRFLGSSIRERFHNSYHWDKTVLALGTFGFGIPPAHPAKAKPRTGTTGLRQPSYCSNARVAL